MVLFFFIIFYGWILLCHLPISFEVISLILWCIFVWSTTCWRFWRDLIESIATKPPLINLQQTRFGRSTYWGWLFNYVTNKTMMRLIVPLSLLLLFPLPAFTIVLKSHRFDSSRLSCNYIYGPRSSIETAILCGQDELCRATSARHNAGPHVICQCEIHENVMKTLLPRWTSLLYRTIPESDIPGKQNYLISYLWQPFQFCMFIDIFETRSFCKKHIYV